MTEEILNNSPENTLSLSLDADSTSSSDMDLEQLVNDEANISKLNKKISELTQELEAYKTAKERQDKIAEQLNEFSELFPEIAIKSVPDEVWENVKRGNTLAASYAIYEKRITAAARRIEEINRKKEIAKQKSLAEYNINELTKILALYKDDINFLNVFNEKIKNIQENIGGNKNEI